MTIATPAWDTWVRETARLQRELLTDAIARYMYELALRVVDEKNQAIERAVQMGETAAAALQTELTEARSEIARLKAELDQRGEHQVWRCMERDFALIKFQLGPHEVSEGDLIRATDTGRELVWMEGAWQDQR